MCARYDEQQSAPKDAQAPVPASASEMDDWFAVSGDMDDFIFFWDDPKAHSEK